MYSPCGNAVLPALGFPIRESADHRLFSAFPRLIAAVHALLRLLVPRHPPCALHILTVKSSPGASLAAASGSDARHSTNCAVFKVRREAFTATLVTEDAAGLSKLNSMQAGTPLPGSVDISGKVNDVNRRPDPNQLHPFTDRVSRLSETRLFGKSESWLFKGSLERR